jgi:hypothetical protein
MRKPRCAVAASPGRRGESRTIAGQRSRAKTGHASMCNLNTEKHDDRNLLVAGCSAILPSMPFSIGRETETSGEGSDCIVND